MVALEDSETESYVQDIISRGKSRISGTASGLPNKDEVINNLTQAEYSVGLVYELDDTYFAATAGLNPCLIYAAYVDIRAYNFFSGLDASDPLHLWHSEVMSLAGDLSAKAFFACN